MLLEKALNCFTSPQMCYESVKRGSHSFDYVPNKYMIKKMCYRLVKKNRLTVICIPMYRNQEMCDKEVEKGPWLLRYFPNKFKTYGMCDKAIWDYSTMKCF